MAARTGRPQKVAHPALLLTACILASSLSFIDGSVVNVALPAIGRDLNAGAADLQWTVNAYTLPLSALLLLGGAAGDRFGRKRLLIGGTILFALASLACALAPSLPVLLAARAAQGIGSALLMPNSLSILGVSFTGAARGRAVGIWAAAGAIAGSIGPPLGGWLVEAVGWPAIFYINLPVAAAAIALATYAVEECGSGRQALDWFGAMLATLALGALTWGLTRWSSERTADLIGGLFVAGGVALAVAFVVAEHRKGDRAMMPTALFGTRAFVGLTVYTFLLYGALGGLILLVPYVLIQAGGYTPLQAGLALLPFAVGIGLGSRAAGQLTERIGPRWPLTIGPGVVAVGFAVAALTDPAGRYWTGSFPALATIAVGMAIAVAPLTTAVLSSVDDAYEGTASGFNSAIARTGGLIATALAGRSSPPAALNWSPISGSPPPSARPWRCSPRSAPSPPSTASAADRAVLHGGLLSQSRHGPFRLSASYPEARARLRLRPPMATATIRTIRTIRLTKADSCPPILPASRRSATS